MYRGSAYLVSAELYSSHLSCAGLIKNCNRCEVVHPTRFELPAEAISGKNRCMTITKNIGMLLLAVYLIIDGLLGFGLNLGPAIFLLYLVALGAGFFILIGR